MEAPVEPCVRPPVELLLGALGVVACPLARGEHGEAMIETAQFYGYEDWGDCFRNVWPRVHELVAHLPSGSDRGCAIELDYRQYVAEKAFVDAVDGWARAMKLTERQGRREWRGDGLHLALDVDARAGGGRVRARLSPL